MPPRCPGPRSGPSARPVLAGRPARGGGCDARLLAACARLVRPNVEASPSPSTAAVSSSARCRAEYRVQCNARCTAAARSSDALQGDRHRPRQFGREPRHPGCAADVLPQDRPVSTPSALTSQRLRAAAWLPETCLLWRSTGRFGTFGVAVTIVSGTRPPLQTAATCSVQHTTCSMHHGPESTRTSPRETPHARAPHRVTSERLRLILRPRTQTAACTLHRPSLPSTAVLLSSTVCRGCDRSSRRRARACRWLVAG